MYIYVWKSYISEFMLRYIIISWEVQQIIYDTFKKKTRIINKNIDLVTKLIYS